jgi:hypothetical protein
MGCDSESSSLFEGRLCLGGREEPATRNVGAGMHEKWPPLANGDPALG